MAKKNLERPEPVTKHQDIKKGKDTYPMPTNLDELVSIAVNHYDHKVRITGKKMVIILEPKPTNDVAKSIAVTYYPKGAK